MQIIRDGLLKARERARNWFRWWLTIIIITGDNVEKDAGGNAFNAVDSVILSSTTTSNDKGKKKNDLKRCRIVEDRDKRKWKENFPESKF